MLEFVGRPLVTPVSVTDGKAPEAKMKTMAARLGKTELKSTKRSHFTAVLRTCTNMLDTIGVQWITAPGEAEKMASTLQLAGKVDAVLTQDGDAFCFGACSIYRTFSCENDAEVEYVSMRTIQAKYSFNRFDFICFGLLCGCDFFPTGVKGIGPKLTIKLVVMWKKKKLNPLRRLSSIKSGTAKDLTKEEAKVERLMKNYPDMDVDGIIEEFKSKQECPLAEKFSIEHRQGSAAKFIDLMEKYLDWTVARSIEKLVEYKVKTMKVFPDLRALNLVKTIKGGKSHLIRWEAGSRQADVKLKTDDVRQVAPEILEHLILSDLPKPSKTAIGDIRRFAVTAETKRKLNSPQIQLPEKLAKHFTPEKLADVSRRLSEDFSLGMSDLCDQLDKSSLDMENPDDIGLDNAVEATEKEGNSPILRRKLIPKNLTVIRKKYCFSDSDSDSS